MQGISMSLVTRAVEARSANTQRWQAKRIVFLAYGIFFVSVAAVLYFGSAFGSDIWPWEEVRLCFFFLGALLAAYGAGCLTVAAHGELTAAVGGSTALAVAFTAFSSQVALVELSGTPTGLIMPAAILGGLGLIAAINLAVVAKTKTALERAPNSLLIVFRIMAVCIFTVGVALLSGVHGLLPWTLSAQTRLLVGCVLIGFSANYAVTALRGSWAGVQVVLVGLLTYDALMLMPLIRHFADVAPEYRLTLVINVGVVLLTASLAIYYLFFRRPLLAARKRLPLPLPVSFPNADPLPFGSRRPVVSFNAKLCAAVLIVFIAAAVALHHAEMQAFAEPQKSTTPFQADAATKPGREVH
jgi:hypothetical protein